jgi:hypothetical protein
MATYTREQCIEKLGELVKAKSRMLLKISESRICIESEFFNYSDVQKITHILQRTSCEWWIYPCGLQSIELRIRLF